METLLQFFRSRSLREMLQELAWLSRYSQHYKKEVLWYIFIGVLGTVVSLVGSILSKHIIDAVTGFNTSGHYYSSCIFCAYAAISDPGAGCLQ